jgi:phosphatidylserine decarboxylase precursor
MLNATQHPAEESKMITRKYQQPLLVVGLLACFALAGCEAQTPDGVAAQHEPIVSDLVTLLDAEPALGEALRSAIDEAALEGIDGLDDFLVYLDELATWVPVERDFVPHILELYYVVNLAPEDRLNRSDSFNDWLHRMVDVYGEYLDTAASASELQSFIARPSYRIEDYFVGPSGWLTFNQFFAREVRPGARPIAAPHDDRVIVAPADAVFMGQWPIDADSTITAKGVKWRIDELLSDSPYADAFAGGTYTHSFLYIDDYHRYHVPVAGTVREVRNISGKVFMDVSRNDEGALDVVDGDTYQFNQERGLIVIDSPEVGLVAVLPIGMSFVSSVNLTARVGDELRKGDEFGYFLFGGSDIVTVLQDRNIVFDAEVGTKYLQGQQVAHVE